MSPPKPAPTDLTKLSVCTSPVYGKLDKLAVLEWRLHHAQLGVQSVHWYVRETGTALEARIRQWNGVLGLTDTWRYAPALATNQSEASKLYNNGAYADQVCQDVSHENMSLAEYTSIGCLSHGLLGSSPA